MRGLLQSIAFWWRMSPVATVMMLLMVAMAAAAIGVSLYSLLRFVAALTGGA